MQSWFLGQDACATLQDATPSFVVSLRLGLQQPLAALTHACEHAVGQAAAVQGQPGPAVGPHMRLGVSHKKGACVRAQKLAGMTGTAVTEAAEFSNIYKLEVTEVPPNRPIDRTDNPDVVFRTEAGPPPPVAHFPCARQLA